MLIHSKIFPVDVDEANENKKLRRKQKDFIELITSSGDNVVVGSTVELDSSDRSFILLNKFYLKI
jgi:hypothetical protein